MHKLASFSLLAGAVLASAVARADTSARLSFDDDTARFAISWPVFSDSLEVDTGWLHHDDDFGGDVVHLGLLRVGRTGSFHAGVGGRALWVDTDPGSDGFALALGGFLRVPFPFHSRLGADGSAYVAPGVLSGGDLDDYFEVTAGLSYRVVEGADVFAGYRLVEVEYDNGPEVELDDDLVFGLRIEF